LLSFQNILLQNLKCVYKRGLMLQCELFIPSYPFYMLAYCKRLLFSITNQGWAEMLDWGRSLRKNWMEMMHTRRRHIYMRPERTRTYMLCISVDVRISVLASLEKNRTAKVKGLFVTLLSWNIWAIVLLIKLIFFKNSSIFLHIQKVFFFLAILEYGRLFDYW